ncbi:MAG: fibronectin type III domain-containing protein, partial [Bacteroidales bacterium]|nr:fibronectin type III domain-containing protein [Bacteroidales bacterium]
DTAAIIKTLNEAKSISSTSFELKGYLVYQGVEQNLSCGFMLSSSQEFDNAVFCAASNVQNDTFFYTAANLQYGTNYYYKALAVNSLSDTVWGDVYSFQTPTGLPFISLSQPSDITLEGFTLTVKKLLDGDTPITEYGVQYDTVNTFSDPVKDTVFEGGLTLQTVVMTGLQQATEYYCRAYAVNSVGVKYSSVVKSKTKFIPIENNYIGEDPEESCPNVLDYVITTQDVSGGLGDFKYFWQQRSSASQWQEAQGQNNGRDYHVQNLDNDTYFRRIVFSENIKDTSNTVYVKVNASIGGNLTFKDTVMKETPQTLKLKNYKGKIVQWEEYVDNQWQTAEMSDSVASLQMSWYTAGDKAVRVKVQNQDCPASYSDTAIIFVCPSESIEQTTGQNAGFVVYPNPANESITVSSDKEEIRSYTVYTSDGRICERKLSLNQNQLILDLSSYSDNVYFININDRYTQSFVVKH